MYVGIDGLARKVEKAYVSIDGVAKEVVKAYVGVDGVARLFWSGGYLYEGVSTFIFDASNAVSTNTVGTNYFTLSVIRHDSSPLDVYIDDVLVSTITDDIEKNADTGEQVITLDGETATLLAKENYTCTVTIKSEGVYSLGHFGFYIAYTTAGKGGTVDAGSYWANMSSAVLSDNINAILDSAFTEFKGTSITIPNSVASIETRAFAECTALTDITFTHKANNPLSIAFDETTVSNCAFYTSSYVTTNVYHKGNASVLNYGWATCLRTVTFLEV